MRNRRSILLVEDNADDQELALMALTDNEAADEVMVASDGEEALAILFETAPARLPRLILLDLKLPKLDGLEVLRRIRAHSQTRWIPVVMLSSSAEAQDLSEAYRSGANSYITKPVEFERFLDAIRRLESYWLTKNELPYG